MIKTKLKLKTTQTNRNGQLDTYTGELHGISVYNIFTVTVHLFVSTCVGLREFSQCLWPLVQIHYRWQANHRHSRSHCGFKVKTVTGSESSVCGILDLYRVFVADHTAVFETGWCKLINIESRLARCKRSITTHSSLN